MFELLFHFLAVTQLAIVKGHSEFYDDLWRVFAAFYVQFINAFYLFGDKEFQRGVDENGLIKSIQRALLQKY